MLLDFRMKRYSDMISGRISLSAEEIAILETWAASVGLSGGQATLPITQKRESKRKSNQNPYSVLSPVPGSPNAAKPKSINIPPPQELTGPMSPIAPPTSRSLNSNDPIPPPSEREPIPPPETERSLVQPPPTERSYFVATDRSSGSSMLQVTMTGNSDNLSPRSSHVPTAPSPRHPLSEPAPQASQHEHGSAVCSTVMDAEAYQELFGDVPQPILRARPQSRSDLTPWIATGNVTKSQPKLPPTSKPSSKPTSKITSKSTSKFLPQNPKRHSGTIPSLSEQTAKAFMPQKIQRTTNTNISHSKSVDTPFVVPAPRKKSLWRFLPGHV
eukprot:c5308_g1_i1.p1 GENE.c5308_g1_i1~~c5308_g1_i1.p1  ORF type:complete len:350 (-),score=41.12 c5308_g1_i1:80-1063(-)